MQYSPSELYFRGILCFSPATKMIEAMMIVMTAPVGMAKGQHEGFQEPM
jgi:hypothetical protein